MSASGTLRRLRRGRPGFRPMMDTLETRQLLTAVTPFLQGTVFNDSNGNGSLDGGEAPLAGATINLYAGTATTPLATTTSGTDGGYVFDSGNVPGGLTVGGTYRLVESAAGYSNTGAQALSQLNSATVTASNTIQVTVTDPTKVLASFTSPTGYGSPPYDRIDYTLNGVGDTIVPTQLNFSLTGDPNVSAASFTSLCVGVNDRLSFNTPFATVIDPQSALPNGGQIAYLYNHYGTSTLPGSEPLPAAVQGLAAKNVAAGLQVAVWELEYGTQFVLTGYDTTFTSAQDYADLQTAANAFLADSAGKSEKVAILDASLTGSLPAAGVAPGGQSVLVSDSANFGAKLIPLGSLSGVVYADANNNGSKDATEAGIGSVPISLTTSANGVTTVVATTTTAADGSYSFANLTPGTYSVVEGPVNGYLPDVTNTGSIAGISVAAGANTPNNNFGAILPGSIAGVVYADKTGDGLSADDTAVAGVTVQLVNSGNVVIATTTSGKDGSYSFPNLAPGTYTVRELVPTGAVQTAPTSLVYTVPLTPGQNVTNENFDNYQTTCSCSCSISNISYSDVGPCGISTFCSLGGNTSEGDQVTVNFTVGGTSSATVTFVTYTATSTFDLTRQTIFSVDTETLAPGRHSLTVTIPDSYYQIDLVCGGAIAHFNPAANVTYHGEGRFLDSDQGGSEVAPTAFASLAGSVFLDNNADGTFGSNDSGLGGVTVKLTGKDLTGQTVSLTRVTTSTGAYSFTGLQPGTYSVKEVTPTGYTTTRDSVGTAGGTLATPSADLISAITLAGGTTATRYNFGEQAVGSPLGGNQTASTCFWNGCSGQALIRSLNGGSCSTSLGTWLAAAFPNSLAGLKGQTNAQVASFYQSAFNSCHFSPLTEGLATALAAYATDSGLAGGNYASCFGLKVTATGSGSATINVGTTFACYGGPQGTISLLQLLQYADRMASNGDAWFQYRLACAFDYVNSRGSC